MRQVVVHRPGGYGRLRIEEHPDPSPGPGEVLVDVESIGVNFADCVVRMGLYASAKEYVGWPITPGFEFAGTVREVGVESSGAFDPGAPVVGVTRFGAYSSCIAVPERQLFPVPAGYGTTEIGAFPVVFLTAWYALHRMAHVRAGETLLVHSAAGGVGGALLQLAKLAGCRTVAVVGAEHKVQPALDLGAWAVVDRSRPRLWHNVEAHASEGYDVVLDANGGRSLRRSYDLLAPEGRLVTYGAHTVLKTRWGFPDPLQLLRGLLTTPRFSPFRLTQDNKSVLGFNLSFLFHRWDLLAAAMEELLEHAAAGRLVKPPLRELPLDDVAEAHRALESAQTVGKLVLVP